VHGVVRSVVAAAGYRAALPAILATTADTAASGGGDVVAIAVAAIGALGVIATAFGPALTERVKMRNTPPDNPAPSPTPGPAADPPAPANGSGPTGNGGRHALANAALGGDIFDALEDSIRDLRAQRDAAQAELRRVQRAAAARIDALQRELHDARVALARLETGRAGP
jgi:hypothetical protein